MKDRGVFQLGVNSKNALRSKDAWRGGRSGPRSLKDRVQVCSVSGELAQRGAPHDLADGRGRGDGVMLDDLLLGAGGDGAGGRAALRT